jgi:hypothetical protein
MEKSRDQKNSPQPASRRFETFFRIRLDPDKSSLELNRARGATAIRPFS